MTEQNKEQRDTEELIEGCKKGIKDMKEGRTQTLEEFKEGVPTAAYVIEKPDYDYGLFWNVEDSSTEIVEDELVTRKDHEQDKKQALKEQEKKFEQLIQNKKDRWISLVDSDWEKEAIKDLTEELLEEVQKTGE